MGDAIDGRRCVAAEAALISRRGFLGASATGLAGRVHGGGKLNLGIETFSYHSVSLEAMIAQLQRLKIRKIEMSRGEFMLFSKPKPERFAGARAQFDAAGVLCVSYYTATIHDDAELETAIQCAKLLGARNITGDATGDMLRRIDEHCTRGGLTFGIHNHFFPGKKFPDESPDEVLAALKGRSKTMGAALDTGQFASCGYDTVAAVRKLAPYLRMVHLKDIEAPGAG